MCIWDGAGTDTLNVSGFAQAQKIDLGAGHFSDVGGYKGNVSIALGCSIENAVGGSGADVLIGNDLANRIIGNGGNDTITGGGGNDQLLGGAGNDDLFGGNGNDVINGGTGQDHLRGDAGADVFVFSSVTDSTASAPDQVLDFLTGVDRIDLRAIDANTLLAGNQAFVLHSAPGGGAGTLWVSNGTLYGDVNGDGVADLAIAFGTHIPTASDLLL